MAKKKSRPKEPKEMSREDFLRLVQKQGIYIRLTKAALKDPEFRNLVSILFTMRMSGAIPNFVAEFDV